MIWFSGQRSLAATIQLCEPDTVKPVVDLLSIDTVWLENGDTYIAPPVALIDNVNTDAEMRPLLIHWLNLPVNMDGFNFCDSTGIFRSYYLVSDLAGNWSDTAFRYIICELKQLLIRNANFLNVQLVPNDHLIKISFLNPFTGNFSMNIINAEGKNLTHYDQSCVKCKEITIPFESYSGRIYFVGVTAEGKTTYQKYSFIR